MSDRHPDPDTLEQTKQEIRSLAGEIARLSRQEMTPGEYFAEFLQRVTSAMAAVGGAVWTVSGGSTLNLLYQINLRTAQITDGGEDQARHDRLLNKVLLTGEPIIVPPYSGAADQEEAGNPTRFLLLVVPLKSGDEIEGIVEIFQRPGASSDVQRGYLRFMLQMTDLAGQWMKSRKLRQYNEQHTLLQRIDEFSQAIHESLDGRETAYVIANEAQRIIGCDRVSVAVRHGGKHTIEAISGQDTFDRRSNMVVLLQRLTRRVLAGGDAMWYTGNTEDLPPQIEQALEDYVDHAHSKTVGILPLRKPTKPDPRGQQPDEEEPTGEIVGALVVEQIEDSTPSTTLSNRTNMLARHASRALGNAYDHNSVFLMPLWRTLGKSRVLVEARNLPKTVAAGVAILIFVLATLLIPIDFNLEGRGELQPVERRHVFSAVDGVVTNVHVGHGDPVKKGDTLLTLQNTDLMVQLENLSGQRRTTLQRMLDLDRQLLDNATGAPEDRARIAGERLQLQQQLASYKTQYELLNTKKEQLTVTSPIDGQVVTWDVERLLINRPVTPGQVLMTVADPNSQWELMVHMPEDNMGYVAAAAAETDEKLKVTYILATDPGQKLEGTVKSVHQLAELHETEGHSVKIAVNIEESDLEAPRPGATATAEVHCGKRSIAFVWLHDVVEFLQTKVFF